LAAGDPLGLDIAGRLDVVESHEQRVAQIIEVVGTHRRLRLSCAAGRQYPDVLLTFAV
jgi:hypothetical protein